MGDLRSALLPYETGLAPDQFDKDMQADWTNLDQLAACRRCLRAAKSFAVINAGLEKVSLSAGYLSLTWATVILLSGHAANLDLWDFWVVTVILTVGAGRALAVESSSKLTRLWQAGCLKSNEGHILPFKGEGNRVRRVLGTLKCAVMLLSCMLALVSIIILSQEQYSKRPAPTLVPALYVFYCTVLFEALTLVITVCHRYYMITHKKRKFLHCSLRNSRSHPAEQALLWRLYARHVLDACITGTVYDGMQCHAVAFLVREMVFHRKRVVEHGEEVIKAAPGLGRVTALVKAFEAHGTTLERHTISWLLDHDPETKFWHQVWCGGREGDGERSC